MRLTHLLPYLATGLFLLLGGVTTAQTTATIGTGTSSSSTRGPFQRSDVNSSTVFSRFVHVYTASELANAGITSGASIDQVNWELASSNVIIGTGDATLKVYVKNSSATAATGDSWTNLIAGSSLLVDNAYNTTNNFPGANGWMPFTFSSPFVYTGGALEIAVDWDCSQVTTPAFSGDGAIKWRWSSTAPDTLVVKKTSSSSPSTNITDLKNERANIQFVFNANLCAQPTALNAANITTTTADLSWVASMGATAYTWKIVPSGGGFNSAAVDSGTTATTIAMTTALSELTAYDLYVEADCGGSTSGFAGPHSFLTLPDAQTTATIGMGTSSSSSRGPFQRSDTSSSTVFSRFVHVYTAGELDTAGLANGTSITALNWELASSNVMIGSGNATLKVYIRNSAATAATAGDWSTLVSGSSLVVDRDFNTTNNFPGANGWMPFAFSTPFVYTGGAVEVAVDWDCSQVSTPAFSGDGSLKWRWESTAPDTLVVKKTSSSSPSTNISDLKDERANIQFVFATPDCDVPTSLNVSNITTNSANLSWTDSTAGSYDWRIVLAGAGVGATAVDSGNTVNLVDTTMSLTAVTAYDLYIRSDCSPNDSSDYAGPYSFTTLCAETPATTITTVITPVLCNGDTSGTIDLTVSAGTPSFSFSWSNGDTTEDISGLAAGLYTVTITDGDGCPFIDSVRIDEPEALMLSYTSTPDTSGGAFGAVSVTVAGGTPPYAYTWDSTVGSADSTGLLAGTYLVEVTDSNGCTDTVSVMVDDVVGISQPDFVRHLSIVPNPTNGLTRIDLELSSTADVHISIYSIRGELVGEFTQENVNQLSHKVDLSAYANGMYFARIAVNGQAMMKKILLHK